MYKKTVIHKNTAAKITALSCLILGGALFILSGNGFVAIPALGQLISILLIGVSIYVGAAFLLRVYTYSIEPNIHITEDDDRRSQFDFIIYDEKGKKRIKVCHVEMTDVIFVRVITPENKKKVGEERKNMKRYTYDTKFAAGRQIEVMANIENEDYSIIVTYDEELLEAFKELTDIKE